MQLLALPTERERERERKRKRKRKRNRKKERQRMVERDPELLDDEALMDKQTYIGDDTCGRVPYALASFTYRERERERE